MTSPDLLSLERFRALAEAYGGCVARWPEHVRSEATRRSKEADFAAVLEQAAVLDDALDLWTVPAPSAHLAHAIAARAPKGSPSRESARRWLWWPGIGLAAALAGGGVGAVAASVFAPTELVSTDISTSFGDIGSQET